MPTELPGDIWKPYIGGLDQMTFRPLNRLVPWKMSRMTLDIDEDKVDTPNNAVPRFRTQIGAKEGGTGTIENASYDIVFNIFGTNYFNLGPGWHRPDQTNAPSAVPFTTVFMRQSTFFRMMVVPADATPNADANGGPWVGRPIRGGAGELLAAMPANLAVGGVTYPTGQAYIFLACKVTRVHHEARAEAGQPFSFDFEICYPFRVPNESLSLITGYGFSEIVNDGAYPGNGGFL